MDNSFILDKRYDYVRNGIYKGNQLIDIPNRSSIQVLSGSRGYGTYHAESDYDLKVVVISNRETMTGYKKDWSTYRDTVNDTMIFSHLKFLELLRESNPNIIDILGYDKEDYIQYDNLGEELIENGIKFVDKHKMVRAAIGLSVGNLSKVESVLSSKNNTSINKEKALLHGLRVLISSINTLSTGKIRSRLDRSELEVVRIESIQNGEVTQEYKNIHDKLISELRLLESNPNILGEPDCKFIEYMYEEYDRKAWNL